MSLAQSVDIISFLTQRIAEYTKCPPAQIHPKSVLIDLGLQSIDAVLLCGEVEDQFEIELDPSTIFEHDTLISFANEIESRISTR